MLSNGRFWASFHVYTGRVRQALMWLERSGEALLDFKVVKWSESSSMADIHTFERRLFEKQSFWREMVISFNYSEEFTDHYEGLNDLPHLISWTVRLDRGAALMSVTQSNENTPFNLLHRLSPPHAKLLVIIPSLLASALWTSEVST